MTKQLRLTRNDKIIAACATGNTNAQISRMFGVSRERVRQILLNNNILNKARGTYPKQVCPACKKTVYYGYISRSKDTAGWCFSCSGKKRKLLWSIKHNLTACVKCGTTQYKHVGRGLCRQCFYQDPITKIKQAENFARYHWGDHHEERLQKMREAAATKRRRI